MVKKISNGSFNLLNNTSGQANRSNFWQGYIISPAYLQFFNWLKTFSTLFLRQPMVHLELRISPRIFEKNRNSPNGILRGLGETDS
jgi:hypothetical protein